MTLATLGARNRSRSPARNIPRWVKVLAAALVCAAVFTIFAARYLEVYRLNREALRLAQLKRNLQTHNAVLREEMKLLHTPGYVEKVAREQLGLIKPDEIALLIVTPPATPPTAPVIPDGDRRSVLARVIRAVRGVFAR